MKGRRHTPEQVVRKLHEADKLIGQGKDLAAVLKHLENLRADLLPLAQAIGRAQPRRRQAAA